MLKDIGSVCSGIVLCITDDTAKVFSVFVDFVLLRDLIQSSLSVAGKKVDISWVMNREFSA